MKYIIALITIMVISQKATAQMAVIEDKDGYTNVRQEPNGNAKVIHKINEGEVFFISEEVNGWMTVHIPHDDFSEDIIRRGTMRGYVHKSRIRPLEKMQKYVGDECLFRYVIQPFSEEGKTLQFEGDDERFIGSINYDPFWGTDGERPKIEATALNISVNGKKIEVPENLLADIYEITNDYDCYKVGDSYYIYQGNSDGAGYYEICWVFDENKLKQRLVGGSE